MLLIYVIGAIGRPAKAPTKVTVYGPLPVTVTLDAPTTACKAVCKFAPVTLYATAAADSALPSRLMIGVHVPPVAVPPIVIVWTSLIVPPDTGTSGWPA